MCTYSPFTIFFLYDDKVSSVFEIKLCTLFLIRVGKQFLETRTMVVVKTKLRKTSICKWKKRKKIKKTKQNKTNGKCV